MPKVLSRIRPHRGFSLLEVLIAITVLSLGMLGTVGLQAASLQVAREARLQASAVRLAQDAVELMRSNLQVASQSDSPYLIEAGAADELPDPRCGYPSLGPCAHADQVARRDLHEWWQRVRRELPGPRAVICRDGDPYDGEHLPRWACAGPHGPLVVKIGWTRANTLRSATGSDATSATEVNQGAFDRALRPGVVLSLGPTRPA